MFSSRSKNAIIVLIYLSERDSKEYISLKEISEYSSISVKYLEQIMPKLIKANYVEAKLGKLGGYRIKSHPEDILIWDILNLFEEEVYPVKELNNGDKNKLGKSLNMWEEFYEKEKEFFSNKTIKDLLNYDYNFDYII